MSRCAAPALMPMWLSARLPQPRLTVKAGTPAIAAPPAEACKKLRREILVVDTVFTSSRNSGRLRLAAPYGQGFPSWPSSCGYDTQSCGSCATIRTPLHPSTNTAADHEITSHKRDTVHLVSKTLRSATPYLGTVDHFLTVNNYNFRVNSTSPSMDRNTHADG